MFWKIRVVMLLTDCCQCGIVDNGIGVRTGNDLVSALPVALLKPIHFISSLFPIAS